MPFRVVLLLAVILAAPAVAQSFPPATGTPRHAVIVFIDGGHPELYDPETAPAIAALARAGTRFTRAEVGFPSDSMPGILGPLTGAPPAVTGVPYDLYYDRGFGQTIEITEELRVPPGKAPHDLLRVGTLFDAAKAKGMKTSFISKHVGYEILQGRGGHGVDLLALPELASWKGSNAEFDAANFALLEEHIRGGSDVAGLYAVAPNYTMKEKGVASAATRASIAVVDRAVGHLVDALRAAGRYDDTVFVITSDHGNSDTPTAIAKSGPASIAGVLEARGIKLAHVTYDNLALVYLADPARRAEATAALEAPETKQLLGIDRIATREELDRLHAFAPDQLPDLVVLCRADVVYTKLPAKKVAEHGGMNAADRRVPLVIAGPGIRQGQVVDDVVNTLSIGPTLATLLGLALPEAIAPALTQALVR
jgi:predicted AlkP superfamily pyrophosphatase or phosphodiesterase